MILKCQPNKNIYITPGHNSLNPAQVKMMHCRTHRGQKFRQKLSACIAVAIDYHTVKMLSLYLDLSLECLYSRLEFSLLFL